VPNAEIVNVRNQPAVELGAIKLERFTRADRRRIERLAVPFEAQVVAVGKACEIGKRLARHCAADGDVNWGSVAHGRVLSRSVDPTVKTPLPLLVRFREGMADG